MSTASAETRANRPVVKKAIGPRLRIIFFIVLALLAMIGANSLYLAGVTFLAFWTGQTYEDYFYNWMFLVHIVLGLLIVTPFLIFGIIHMRNTKDRKIRRTVMIGYALFGVCLVVLITGFLLFRSFVDLKQPALRSLVYWLHVAGPLAGGWLPGLWRVHRAGRRARHRRKSWLLERVAVRAARVFSAGDTASRYRAWPGPRGGTGWQWHAASLAGGDRPRCDRHD
ncbi:MAG: hypothetical protein ACKON9_15010 [Planctomycetaceae bacterium]